MKVKSRYCDFNRKFPLFLWKSPIKPLWQNLIPCFVAGKKAKLPHQATVSWLVNLVKNKIIAKNGSRNTVKSNEKYGNKFPDRETNNLIRTVFLTVKAQIWIHIEIWITYIYDFPLLILYLPFKCKIIYNDIKFCHSIEFFTPRYLIRNNKLHWASLRLRGHGNKFHATATIFAAIVQNFVSMSVWLKNLKQNHANCFG